MKTTDKFSDRHSRSIRSFNSPIRLRSGDKTFRPVTVDQVGSQGFALKANGFPRSDISMLAKASSELELREAIRQMKNASTSKVSMTYEEALKSIKPRSIDLPHEREVYAEYVFNTTGKSLQDLYSTSTDKVNAETEHNSESAQGSATE